jgi:hypothetical protein
MRQNEMHEVEPGTNLQMQTALLLSSGSAFREHSTCGSSRRRAITAITALAC